MNAEIALFWEQLKEKAGPYPPAAFSFVQEGLRHTCESLFGDEGESEQGRHVSGQQLCLGLRDHAIRQFGPLARTVLDSWHIHRTEDFGRIVFAMVEAKLLRKTEEDTLEDFEYVYDFDEAFGRELEPC